MKHLLSALALLTLCGCAHQPRPQRNFDTVFLEDKYSHGSYAGVFVHKTAWCNGIDWGVRPMKMSVFAAWYNMTEHTDGTLAAAHLGQRLHYCTKCLNEIQIKQLDSIFYSQVEVVYM